MIGGDACILLVRLQRYPMSEEEYTRNESEYPWEYEPGEEGRNDVIRWRTLLSGDRTPTRSISMGTLELPPGSSLDAHHHAPSEVYFVTEGSGTLLLGAEHRAVRAGDVVFIPGDCVHGVKNTGDEMLKLLWVFPTHTWPEIEYHQDDIPWRSQA
jgi:quercetin dioxygenase-like cupin family protein